MCENTETGSEFEENLHTHDDKNEVIQNESIYCRT